MRTSTKLIRLCAVVPAGLAGSFVAVIGLGFLPGAGLVFAFLGTLVISVVLVTFISLTFVGTAILMQMQIGQMKTYWYDRAQVAVYMCTETDVSTTCQGQDATAEQIGKQLGQPRPGGEHIGAGTDRLAL